MAVSLSLSLSESDINQAANTSKVTAKLYAKSTSGSYNNSSRSGYITIDGTKYTFSHSFGANKSTLLATKSKTITHNADGSKTITVKGWYSTDVSSGNISTSKSFTLAKIRRQFTVTLDPQQGSVSKTSYTKTYGVSLSLPTPTRPGYTFGGWWTGTNGTGTNYNTTYTANAVDTLYAKWTEKTATLSYNNGGRGTAPASVTMKYTTATYAAAAITASGYSFTGWKRSDNGDIVNANGLVKRVNTIPSALTLTAQWNPRSYIANFDGNGNDDGTNPPSSVSVTYNTSFTFPTQNTLTKSGYTFKGWCTNAAGTGTVYTPGTKITWQFANDTTFYAKWESIIIDINYLYYTKTTEDFTNTSNYGVYFTDDTVVQYHDGTAQNIIVPDLNQYTFAECWTINKPNSKIYTEYGVSFPAGIVPHNYDITSNPDGYLKSGDVISNVVNTVNLYPVYKDNTPSAITIVDTSYDYVNQSITENNYFSYISGQTSDIDTLYSSEYVITYAKFRTNAGAQQVSLISSDIQANIVENDSVSESTEITLNDVYFRTLTDTETNVSTIYVIYKNNTALETTKNYILTIYNIKDSFGKLLDNVVIYIYPPKIIRDVNKDGDVIAFFSEAIDYGEDKVNHTYNEIWNNGILYSDNFLINLNVENEEDEELLRIIDELELSEILV